MASGSAEGSPGPSRTSRASSTRPFIGHSCQDVPPGGLASQKDVLRLFAYFREQEKVQFKSVAQMCCNQNRFRETLCETEDGCLQRGETCLLFKVKLKWLQAGIATLADRSIREKLCKLQEKYQHIFFIRKRKNPSSIQQHTNYIRDIEQTFDIGDVNARLMIENDPNRTEEAKLEDLSFYDDFLGDGAQRKWQLGKKDGKYSDAWMKSFLSAQTRAKNKEVREERLEVRREQEEMEKRERMRRVEVPEGIEDEISEAGQDEVEEGFIEKERKKIRSTRSGESGEDPEDEDDGYVLAKIPKEILKLTSAFADRMEFSHSDHYGIICALVKCCLSPEGLPLDINQFPLSVCTSYRRRKEVMREIYEESRESFRDKAVTENWPLFLHLDTKELTDTIGPGGAGVKHKRERLAVSVS